MWHVLTLKGISGVFWDPGESTQNMYFHYLKCTLFYITSYGYIIHPLNTIPMSGLEYKKINFPSP